MESNEALLSIIRSRLSSSTDRSSLDWSVPFPTPPIKPVTLLADIHIVSHSGPEGNMDVKDKNDVKDVKNDVTLANTSAKIMTFTSTSVPVPDIDLDTVYNDLRRYVSDEKFKDMKDSVADGKNYENTLGTNEEEDDPGLFPSLPSVIETMKKHVHKQKKSSRASHDLKMAIASCLHEHKLMNFIENNRKFQHYRALERMVSHFRSLVEKYIDEQKKLHVLNEQSVYFEKRLADARVKLEHTQQKFLRVPPPNYHLSDPNYHEYRNGRKSQHRLTPRDVRPSGRLSSLSGPKGQSRSRSKSGSKSGSKSRSQSRSRSRSRSPSRGTNRYVTNHTNKNASPAKSVFAYMGKLARSKWVNDDDSQQGDKSKQSTTYDTQHEKVRAARQEFQNDIYHSLSELYRSRLDDFEKRRRALQKHDHTLRKASERFKMLKRPDWNEFIKNREIRIPYGPHYHEMLSCFLHVKAFKQIETRLHGRPQSVHTILVPTAFPLTPTGGTTSTPTPISISTYISTTTTQNLSTGSSTNPMPPVLTRSSSTKQPIDRFNMLMSQLYPIRHPKHPTKSPMHSTKDTTGKNFNTDRERLQDEFMYAKRERLEGQLRRRKIIMTWVNAYMSQQRELNSSSDGSANRISAHILLSRGLTSNDQELPTVILRLSTPPPPRGDRSSTNEVRSPMTTQPVSEATQRVSEATQRVPPSGSTAGPCETHETPIHRSNRKHFYSKKSQSLVNEYILPRKARGSSILSSLPVDKFPLMALWSTGRYTSYEADESSSDESSSDDKDESSENKAITETQGGTLYDDGQDIADNKVTYDKKSKIVNKKGKMIAGGNKNDEEDLMDEDEEEDEGVDEGVDEGEDDDEDLMGEDEEEEDDDDEGRSVSSLVRRDILSESISNSERSSEDDDYHPNIFMFRPSLISNSLRAGRPHHGKPREVNDYVPCTYRSLGRRRRIHLPIVTRNGIYPDSIEVFRQLFNVPVSVSSIDLIMFIVSLSGQEGYWPQYTPFPTAGTLSEVPLGGFAPSKTISKVSEVSDVSKATIDASTTSNDEQIIDLIFDSLPPGDDPSVGYRDLQEKTNDRHEENRKKRGKTTSYRPDFHIPAKKSPICAQWSLLGRCKYGDRCDYAHPLPNDNTNHTKVHQVHPTRKQPKLASKTDLIHHIEENDTMSTTSEAVHPDMDMDGFIDFENRMFDERPRARGSKTHYFQLPAIINAFTTSVLRRADVIRVFFNACNDLSTPGVGVSVLCAPLQTLIAEYAGMPVWKHKYNEQRTLTWEEMEKSIKRQQDDKHSDAPSGLKDSRHHDSPLVHSDNFDETPDFLFKKVSKSKRGVTKYPKGKDETDDKTYCKPDCKTEQLNEITRLKEKLGRTARTVQRILEMDVNGLYMLPIDEVIFNNESTELYKFTKFSQILNIT